MTQEMRHYLYTVLVALVAVAVTYGLIRQEDAAVWVALAAAILSSGGNVLAAKYSSKNVVVEPKAPEDAED